MKISPLLLLLPLAAGLLYWHFKPVAEPESPAPSQGPGGRIPLVTLANGQTLTQVSVRRKDPDGFVVQSAQGVVKIYTRTLRAGDIARLSAAPPAAPDGKSAPASPPSRWGFSGVTFGRAELGGTSGSGKK